MKKNVTIKDRTIGTGHEIYIVAEMSSNHLKNFDRASNIIKAAKEAGADAIKVQTYTPATLTIDSDNEYFHIGKGTIWEGKSLFELYNEAYMPWEWTLKLKEIADDLDIAFFSTPFDETAIELLEEIDVPAYKIASFEIIDIPLIRRVAKTHKPIILSTGMASLAEIDEAMEAIRSEGGEESVLLKCTSAYPASPEDMNLRTIPHMAQAFNCPVGLSDHTLGIAAPIAAAALGACMIEKHFTLSRSVSGPDSAFSLEPDEFKSMVKAIRTAEKALGGINYGVNKRESGSRLFRRSLFVVEDMKAGDIFSEANIRSIRPGYGLSPKYLNDILGNKTSQDIARGTPFDWSLLKVGK